MSLLGIPINPLLAPARATSQYGFADDNDKRLLEAIGAIKVIDGVESLKHKKEDVAALLNWVAEGKKGDLPDLAKRLLCLTREKLRRGAVDAGTATMPRNYQNKLIAEIDGILTNSKTFVECVVDIEEKKCDEKVHVATDATVPLALPNPANASVGTKDPGFGQNHAVAAAGAKLAPGAPGAKTNEAQHVAPLTPASVPSAPPVDVEFNKIIEKLAAILTNPVNGGLVKRVVFTVAHLFKNNEDLIVNKLSTLADVLKTLESDISATEQVDEVIGKLGVKVPEDEKPAAAGVAEAVTAAVEKAIGPRRYTCSDKVSCLQQLVYATCGEASLLDPLIDHLNALDATISTLPQSGEAAAGVAASGLQDKIAGLRSIIESKTDEFPSTNTSDTSLRSRLTALEDQISGVSNEVKRKAIQEEIQSIRTLLEMSNTPDHLEELKIQLKEERRLLDSLLLILPDGDPLIDETMRLRSEVEGEITNFGTSKSNTVKTQCNKRSYIYRQKLEEAKKQEMIAKDAAMSSKDAQIKQQTEDIDALRTTMTALEAAMKRSCDEQIAAISARCDETKRGLEAQIAALQTRNADLEAALKVARGASAAANQRAEGESAKVAALNTQLAKLQGLLAEAEAKKQANAVSIASLTSNLGTTRTERNSAKDIATRLETDLTAANAEVAKLTTELAGLNATADAAQARITELEKELTAAKEGVRKCEEALASKVTNANARAKLQTALDEANARVTGLGEELAAAKADCDKKDVTIAEKEANLAAARAAADKLQGDLEQRDARITELEAALRNCDEEKIALQTKIGSVEASLREADVTADQLREAIATLEEARARITELDAELTTLRARCGENDDLRREIDKLTAELAAEKARCDSLVAAAATAAAPARGRASSPGLSYKGIVAKRYVNKLPGSPVTSNDEETNNDETNNEGGTKKVSVSGKWGTTPGQASAMARRAFATAAAPAAAGRGAAGAIGIKSPAGQMQGGKSRRHRQRSSTDKNSRHYTRKHRK